MCLISLNELSISSCTLKVRRCVPPLTASMAMPNLRVSLTYQLQLFGANSLVNTLKNLDLIPPWDAVTQGISTTWGTRRLYKVEVTTVRANAL